MRRIIGFAAVSIVLAATGCSSVGVSSQPYRSARLEKVAAQPSEQTLKSGDRIVVRLHTLSMTQQEMTEVIDEQGFVKLPHIGMVKIGDMTTSRAEDSIEQAYVGAGIYRKDAIQVAIVPPASEFYVQGFVRNPGSFRFTRNLTVLQAVSMAGGPTEFAHPRVRKLNRHGQTFVIDVERVREGTEQDRIVEPGDIIDIPRGWL